MYILLTGKKPFGNNMEITSGSANFNRPVFEKIPQDALELITKMLTA